MRVRFLLTGFVLWLGCATRVAGAQTLGGSSSAYGQSQSMCFQSSYWDKVVMDHVLGVIGSDAPSMAALQQNAHLPRMWTGNTLVVTDSTECATVARAFAQWKKGSPQAVPKPVVIVRAGDYRTPQQVRYIIYDGSMAREWDVVYVFDGLLTYLGGMTI